MQKILQDSFNYVNFCENIKLEENIFNKTEKLNLYREKWLKIVNYDYLKNITIKKIFWKGYIFLFYAVSKFISYFTSKGN